jgi:5-formaminoimidazole-4-carboxamide-1-beta-D-ribofuranosyl 5'-monophosphate synthetase
MKFVQVLDYVVHDVSGRVEGGTEFKARQI